MSTNLYGKAGWTPERIPDLNGKTYVITGANSGTGYQASKILLSKGAEVVMLNRNEKKSTTAISELKKELGQDIKVSFIKMDLAQKDSVTNAAKEVLAKVSTIEALICNAAVAQVATQKMTPDGNEMHLGINHYGHFLLTQMLHDKVEQGGQRIVMVTSEGYKMGLKTIQFDDMNFDKNYHPNNTYCHSKLAQMMFGYALHDRLSAAGKVTQVYVCHPGASKTSLIDEEANKVTRFMYALLVKTPLVQSAEKGAYPELMCATEKDLDPKGYYGPTGRMNWVGPVGQCDMEDFVTDKAMADRLWEVSEQATGVSWAI